MKYEVANMKYTTGKRRYEVENRLLFIKTKILSVRFQNTFYFYISKNTLMFVSLKTEN
jgi:hypothetical protein